VFLSWFIKLLLLQIGGFTLYRRGRPFLWGCWWVMSRRWASPTAWISSGFLRMAMCCIPGKFQVRKLNGITGHLTQRLFFSMLKNYLMIAVRHLVKNEGNNLLNILGLTLGMTQILYLLLLDAAYLTTAHQSR
jgi:hypothetical protein